MQKLIKGVDVVSDQIYKNKVAHIRDGKGENRTIVDKIAELWKYDNRGYLRRQTNMKQPHQHRHTFSN